MNLIGMMVAVSLMSIGALGALYLLIGPPIALSRLSAQTEADAIVESLRWQAWRGKNVTAVPPSPADPTELKINGSDPGRNDLGSCSLKRISNLNQYVVITCVGPSADLSSSDVHFRKSSAVLIGAGAEDGKACESDLFPVPCFPVTAP